LLLTAGLESSPGSGRSTPTISVEVPGTPMRHDRIHEAARDFGIHGPCRRWQSLSCVQVI
jgi:hypothetical protein